jgi:hypothetical protein
MHVLAVLLPRLLHEAVVAVWVAMRSEVGGYR